MELTTAITDKIVGNLMRRAVAESNSSNAQGSQGPGSQGTGPLTRGSLSSSSAQNTSQTLRG